LAPGIVTAEISQMMSESLKKKVAYVTLGGFGSAVLFPVASDCWGGNFCAVETPEIWHVEQQAPTPTQTTFNFGSAIGTSIGTVYTGGFGDAMRIPPDSL
jgi:hypothetical protein